MENKNQSNISTKQIIVFLSIVVFLLVFRSQWFTGDSLAYAKHAIIGDPGMYHAHHLLYIPFIHGFYQLCSVLNLSVTPLFIGQLHNIIWASIAVITLYNILRLQNCSHIIAMISSGLLLFSCGMLKFTTQIEVYVPGMAALAMLILSLLRDRAQPFRVHTTLVQALLLAAAVFYHQSNVLIVVPLTILLHQCCRPVLKAFLIFSMAGTVVLVSYLYAYHLTSDVFSISTFIHFCLGYISHPSPDWGTINNVSLMGVVTLLYQQAWNLVYSPNLILGLLIGVMVWFFLAIPLRENFVTLQQRRADVALQRFCFVWLLIFYAFFLWWLPGEKEFYIITLLPLLILIGLGLQRIADRTSWQAVSLPKKIILFFFATVYLGVNGSALIYAKINRAPGYLLATDLAGIRSDHPSLLTLTDYSTQQHLGYYFSLPSKELRLIRLAFLQKQPLPDAPVNGSLLKLEYFYPGYLEDGFSGDTHPQAWLAFFDWLLQCHPTADAALSCFQVRLIQTPSNNWYVIALPSRQEFAGYPRLFDYLDLSLEHNRLKTAFSHWFNQNRDKLK